MSTETAMALCLTLAYLIALISAAASLISKTPKKEAQNDIQSVPTPDRRRTGD